MVFIEYFSRFMLKVKISLHQLINRKLYQGVKLHGVPRLLHRQNIKISKGVNINENVFLHGAGGIEIGENTTLSYGSTVLSTKHSIDEWSKYGSKAEHVYNKVRIGNSVWLCSNVTVLDGVEIADGVIIAAGSVVTRSIKKSNALYGGIPAKYLKDL